MKQINVVGNNLDCTIEGIHEALSQLDLQNLIAEFIREQMNPHTCGRVLIKFVDNKFCVMYDEADERGGDDEATGEAWVVYSEKATREWDAVEADDIDELVENLADGERGEAIWNEIHDRFEFQMCENTLYATLICGKFDMTWDDVLDLVRENPQTNHPDEDCVVSQEGFSWTMRELAKEAGVELEVLK